jgi:GxxExxY protein
MDAQKKISTPVNNKRSVKREKGKGVKREKQMIDNLIYKVIGCMIDVHKELGPGFLESVYRSAVAVEFQNRGILFESEKELTLRYKGEIVGIHRLDLFVENELVVELKTVEELHKKHYAQVRSYLKAVNRPIGLLVNFADFQLDARKVEVNR